MPSPSEEHFFQDIEKVRDNSKSFFQGSQKKPVAGFIFNKPSKENVLKPANRFEDEEEEEESNFNPLNFRKEIPSADPRIAEEEEERKKRLAESINQDFKDSYPEQIETQEKTDSEIRDSLIEAEAKPDETPQEEIEPETKVLELNIDGSEEENEPLNEVSSVDKESELTNIETGFTPALKHPDQDTTTIPPSIEQTQIEKSLEEPFKEVGQRELDQEMPVKIFSGEKENEEEQKLIDEGEPNEQDEIIPITINTTPPPSKLEVREIPLEAKLEKELEDQASVNPNLSEVLVEEKPEEIARSTQNQELSSKVDPAILSIPKNIEDDSNQEVKEKDFSEEIFNAWEKFKNSTDKSVREKIISEIGYQIARDQETKGNVFDAYKAVDKAERSLFFRLLILDEKEGIEEKTQKSINLAPLEEIKDEENKNEEETGYQKNILKSFAQFENVPREDRTVLRDFLSDLLERLRFQKREGIKAPAEEELEIEEEEEEEIAELENLNSEQNTPIPEKIALRNDLSRGELGKIIIDLAREEIENNGSIPDNTVLENVYNKEFEDFLRSCSLLDLEVIIKSNNKVLEAAKEKNIESIITLSQVLDTYLKTKRDEKERELREYTAKSLESRV